MRRGEITEEKQNNVEEGGKKKQKKKASHVLIPIPRGHVREIIRV
jgi:hypothetical protein